MQLKPQDVYVCLKLVSQRGLPWTYVRLATELFLSASEVNAAVKRALEAGLLRPPIGQEGNPQPVLRALAEFLVHGIQFVFPPDLGGLTRGMPTAFSAPPLAGLVVPSGEPPPVWPYSRGEVRGYAFLPLYKTVPQAVESENGDELYSLLALVDAIREKGGRQRKVASLKLKALLR